MSPFDLEWVVLFGGAQREEIISALLEYNVKVHCVFVPINQSDKLACSIASIKSKGLLVIEVKRDALENNLKNYSGMALLSIGFPFILSESIINYFPLALNMHPTLLPSYRGPTSGAFILINNEKKTGSTVHFLEPEMDAGDIIAQSVVELSVFDTVRSMQKKVYKTEPQLLIEAFRKLERGIVATPQNIQEASIFPRRTPEDSRIDPNKPLRVLFNEIRACDPESYPAFFYVEGQKVCVKLWRPDRPKEDDEESL